MSQTPHIKFEHSPADSVADSFVSTPGTAYPTLFPDINPADVMTPRSFDDESIFGDSMCGGSLAGTPAPEKKPTKKRKSWGQQLPEPKTNLPPRKRAKTEDEKEQRRVERVLRNRRAAQSSRERKRQEVEALEGEKRAIERRNHDLEMRLQDMEARNLMLQQQLEQLTGNMTVFRSSSVASSPGRSEQIRSQPTPVTFSQELFGSHDQHTCAATSMQQPPMDITAPVETVNPASLSPEIRPVAESTSNASSSDMTQHPAVSVGRATALDGGFNLDTFSHLSNYGDSSLHQSSYRGYFDTPDASPTNNYLLDTEVLPLTNAFDLNYDHLAGDHDSDFNGAFNIDDFLHQTDDQPAPEVQPSDTLAERTPDLQPQLGASSYGCDDGGNAVSV